MADYERDRLQKDIYEVLGDRDSLIKLAVKDFGFYRSIDALNDLIALLGESERPRIQSDEVTKILRTPGFSVRSAAFLVGTNTLRRRGNS